MDNQDVGSKVLTENEIIVLLEKHPLGEVVLQVIDQATPGILQKHIEGLQNATLVEVAPGTKIHLEAAKAELEQARRKATFKAHLNLGKAISRVASTNGMDVGKNEAGPKNKAPLPGVALGGKRSIPK